MITEGNDTGEVIQILVRLGFDNIAGFLAGGMLTWHMSGMPSGSQPVIGVRDLCALLDQDFQPWILDVRKEVELDKDGRISGAQHIHITQIADRKDEVPKDRKVYIFCGSGLRSMIAASYLERHGWKELVVILGGMAGWRSLKCPIKKSSTN